MKNKILANLALLMTALIWGLSFVAQRESMDHIGPFTFNAVRSFLGCLSLLPLIFWVKISRPDKRTRRMKRYQHMNLARAGIGCGLALFTAMSIQQYCMQYVTAGKAGFITALYIVIVLSITVANLFAIRQSELKRFMAFSSISQAGYIMLAVCGDNAMVMSSLMFYVLVYVVANMSVFTVIGVVEQKNGGTTEMSSYNGLYQTNPKLSFLMTLALFSLAGIPPFAGMFSKFFVFMAAAQSGTVWAYIVVFIALINTVISLYYYLLIVKAMYINKTDAPLPAFKSDCNTKLALALCTIGILVFGVFSFFYDWIAQTVG